MREWGYELERIVHECFRGYDPYRSSADIQPADIQPAGIQCAHRHNEHNARALLERRNRFRRGQRKLGLDSFFTGQSLSARRHQHPDLRARGRGT